MAKSSDAKQFLQLERLAKGFANRRRVQILYLLAAQPRLDLSSIARACAIHFQTATEHTTKLVNSGLIQKERRAKHVLHELSPLGQAVVTFLNGMRSQV